MSNSAPTSPATLQVPDPDVRGRVLELDLEALARAVHHGRFNGRVSTPWEDEDQGGKAYCFRIANVVHLHLLAALPLDGREVERQGGYWEITGTGKGHRRWVPAIRKLAGEGGK